MGSASAGGDDDEGGGDVDSGRCDYDGDSGLDDDQNF